MPFIDDLPHRNQDVLALSPRQTMSQSSRLSPPWMKAYEEWHKPPINQWEFQDPKMEVLYHILGLYPLKSSPEK